MVELVKQLAHSLLADDERLLADAMPREPAGAGVRGPAGGAGAWSDGRTEGFPQVGRSNAARRVSWA